jgi:hypothetical protein
MLESLSRTWLAKVKEAGHLLTDLFQSVDMRRNLTAKRFVSVESAVCANLAV